MRALLSTVPVAWDETPFLAADSGSHVVVARRKGRTRYLAGVNGRTLTISPGLDSSAPGCTPPTGRAQRSAVIRRRLPESPIRAGPPSVAGSPDAGSRR
ncbi:glycoside hydrolase family 97 C-terminal domain-containing protein [Streptomyces sp. NPDC055506]